MTSLQFAIDNICANFTVESMHRLVETMLDHGPCTVDEIAISITRNDTSLDFGSAHGLAEVAVQSLAQSGVIAVRDSHVSRAV